MMKLFIGTLAMAAAAIAAPLTSDPSDPSRFTFYDMLTPLAGPCDLCNGPDGAIWGEDILSNNLFRINTTTGKVEEFPIPYTLEPANFTSLPGNYTTRGAFACAIRPGADGNIYASAGVRNQLVRINPTSKEITVFTPPNNNPAGNLQPFNDMYTDDKGMFFTQTTGGTLMYFEYASQSFRTYQVPGGPLGMFVAHDGSPYYAGFFGQIIGRLNKQTGKVTVFQMPPTCLTPSVIRVETENRYIWATCLVSNSVARLDPRTGDVKVYDNPDAGGLASEDTKSPDGRVWFSAMTQNILGYINPKTGKVSTINPPPTFIPAPVSLPFEYTVPINYFENGIWFAQVVSNRVGRYQL